jgi:hypothetical protein
VWQSLAQVPTPRAEVGGAAIGPRIYVVAGGHQPGISVTGAVEAYTWR